MFDAFLISNLHSAMLFQNRHGGHLLDSATWLAVMFSEIGRPSRNYLPARVREWSGTGSGMPERKAALVGVPARVETSKLWSTLRCNCGTTGQDVLASICLQPVFLIARQGYLSVLK